MLTILKASSTAAILAAAALSFVHAHWGIPCLALSFLFAQWLNRIENRLYADWTQESLFVVLQSVQGLHGTLKPGALSPDAARPA